MAHPAPLVPPAAPRRTGALVPALAALFLGARALVLLAPVGAAFVIVTALVGGVVEDARLRVAVGGAAALGLPLALRWRVARFVAERTRHAPPAAGWFVSAVDLALAALLCLGAADDVGRALRRRGDWFVGERHGMLARGYRRAVGDAAAWLERFDPPPEVLAALERPPDPRALPHPPPPGTPPPAPAPLVGYHPLGGPTRQLPWSASRRFGAARPQPRPAECELGHCGVDLGGTLGEPVYAVLDGVVEKIERDEARGGRAGRYLRIGHGGGRVVTRYIHLDTIRADLKEGDAVRGGEPVGTLGKSGILHSAAHLHFGLSVRAEGGTSERYVDPEPLLRRWRIVEGPAVAAR